MGKLKPHPDPSDEPWDKDRAKDYAWEIKAWDPRYSFKQRTTYTRHTMLRRGSWHGLNPGILWELEQEALRGGGVKAWIRCDERRREVQREEAEQWKGSPMGDVDEDVLELKRAFTPIVEKYQEEMKRNPDMRERNTAAAGYIHLLKAAKTVAAVKSSYDKVVDLFGHNQVNVKHQHQVEVLPAGALRAELEDQVSRLEGGGPQVIDAEVVDDE